MSSSDGASSVYANLLLMEKLGYPLWYPDLDENLPPEYQDTGVCIGDVGSITGAGQFEFYFNVYDGGNRAPPGFQPWQKLDTSYSSNMRLKGTVIKRGSVTNVSLKTEGSAVASAPIGAGIEFTCSDDRNAILVLPDGACCEDLKRPSKFLQLLTDDTVLQWLDFTEAESLLLVTGYAKSLSWGVAAVLNTSRQASVSLTFNALKVEGRFTGSYSWTNTSDGHYRAGPMTPPQNPNQCIFLRGYKLSSRKGLMNFKRLKARITDISGPKIYEPRGSKGGSRPVFPDNRGSGSGASLVSQRDRGAVAEAAGLGPEDGEVSIEALTDRAETCHPSDVINAYLLEKFPDTKIAITHDDDWCALVEEADKEFVDDEELLRRVDQKYRAVLESGYARLVPLTANRELTLDKGNFPPVFPRFVGRCSDISSTPNHFSRGLPGFLKNARNIDAREGTSSQPPPATSDIDVSKSVGRPKRVTRASSGSAAKRRAAGTEDDSDNSDPTALPSKRRVLSRTVYVEVPTVKGARKAQPKVPMPPAKNKGKGRRQSFPPPTRDGDDISEDAIISEAELEYDENASIEESDDSGSEFQALEGEFTLKSRKPSRRQNLLFNDQESSDDENAEEIMLDVAIRESLRTARLDQTGSNDTGPSSKTSASSNSAAERRLADNLEFILTGESEAENSDDEALFIATKKSVKIWDTTSTKFMSVSQRRKLNKEKRKFNKAANRRGTRKEELAMIREVGRPLTMAEKTILQLHKHHEELKNVWGDIEETIPIVIPQKAKQPENLKVMLLPFQQESLYWMQQQEQGIWHGGMLADEMGMGKTIQIISLFVSNPQRPNLVVAPTVAVMQWRKEIATHTEGLKVLVWHGSSRESDVEKLKKFDVVLTTYAILESCFRKQQSGFKRQGKIIKEQSPVHQIHWSRIVLDEAHNIKERSTNTAKAAFELKSDYKWCLSGTPLQNRVGELYSLVRFLGGDPFSYYFCKKCDCKSLHWKFTDKRSCDDCGHSPTQHTCFWNNEILTPIQKDGMVGPGKIAFKKLRILLDRMMLRRTKLQRADDLGLPPRTVIVRRDYFSPEEKELYLSLFSDAKRKFSTYVNEGTVLNNYSNIFSLLTRMRQLACHPDLVLRSKTNAKTFLGEEEFSEATVCRLCNDIAEDAIQSKCRHIFDRECIRQYLDTFVETDPLCPVCHLALTIDLEAPALELEENIKARQGILGRLNLDTWRSSTKIEALLEELSNLRMQDSSTKSLVFSQFVNFLDLISYRLQKAGFKICRLEGTMSPQARDATIQHFMNNVDVTVFLVSLKAGGVALNLTEASRVYLMDSWWNPAVEFQAMDRIHRLGQHRPVEAIKLVVEDSIESRIVQLQEKKSAMVDATLSTDDSAMGRLTPEDLGFLFKL